MNVVRIALFAVPLLFAVGCVTDPDGATSDPDTIEDPAPGLTPDVTPDATTEIPAQASDCVPAPTPTGSATTTPTPTRACPVGDSTERTPPIPPTHPSGPED
jgi:hypothetical protein